ncbi:GatB/YqeY domain-containing protein [uncultured Clostridium sp.]|uniref:GatB/YqeY domain-containing protein n=1 Tax=uncultured Clostridium sp. TaxID=59620 RepID=UPI0026364DA1|nr:GatB/YqeY domain-containing protein [uncultured Clostridium sp.]
MKTKLMLELKNAMKEKNIVKKNTIQLIRSSILQYEKDKQIESDNNQIITIIASEMKKRKDALEQFRKANNEDLINQTLEEIKILEEYLPKQLSDEELDKRVNEIINEQDAWTIKDDFGRIMRVAKESLGNTVDGKRLSTSVREILTRRESELCQ